VSEVLHNPTAESSEKIDAGQLDKVRHVLTFVKDNFGL
jgi:hypothetical protein